MAVAKRLAEAHFRAEPNLKQVFLLEPVGEDSDEEPVKLLEIVEGSLAQGVYPIGFAANPRAGLPYRSLVVELAPEEWASLRQQGSIRSRGRDWTIGQELMPAPVEI